MGKLLRKEKKIIEILSKLYPTPQSPLNFNSNFTLLIAVLLSANCTDKVVNRVTPILFKQANSPLQIKKLGEAKIRKIIKPCGLSNKKAKAIYDLSIILINKYNGQVPSDLEQLKKLPGVGRKTALVVLAQGFVIPTFPVDTHIHRLAKRWGLSDGKNVAKTEKDLKKIFPKDKWIDLHIQIIYYGREYCPARGHDFKKCIICQKFNNDL